MYIIIKQYYLQPTLTTINTIKKAGHILHHKYSLILVQNNGVECRKPLRSHPLLPVEPMTYLESGLGGSKPPRNYFLSYFETSNLHKKKKNYQPNQLL